MSKTVVTSGFYSVAHIVKPFQGFEEKYQGRLVAEYPIAAPGGYDVHAGESGYDPNLVQMLPTPMGSRVKLWLPRFTPDVYDGDVPLYQYKILWRVRSSAEAVRDKNSQLAGHFNRLLFGREQIAASFPEFDSSGPRYVIPCAIESIQIPTSPATEPEIIDLNSVQIRTNRQNSSLTWWRGPIMPKIPTGAVSRYGYSGIYNQGYFPNGNNTAGGVPGEAGGPNYFVYNTEAQGDEMGLLITRGPVSPSGTNQPNWDFAGVDRVLSTVLGNGNGTLPNVPNIGIYVFTGSSAS